MARDDMISGLPFKKNATVSQLIYLVLAVVTLLTLGWMLKADRDGISEEISASNTSVLKAIEPLQKASEEQGRQLQSVRKFYWSTADQQRWATQLDRANRNTVPGLIVPDVPNPVAEETHPQ